MQWNSELLQNELSCAFKPKRRLKIVLDGLVLDLVPKTEPIMIAPMNRAVNKQIGMINLFLKYQCLVNVTKITIKYTVRTRCS